MTRDGFLPRRVYVRPSCVRGTRLLDRVREVIRIKHYSIHTEQAGRGSAASDFMDGDIHASWVPRNCERS